MKPDATAECSADGADPELHLHFVSVLPGLSEFLATGEALGNSIRIGEKTPDAVGRNPFEDELPFDLHRISPRVR